MSSSSAGLTLVVLGIAIVGIGLLVWTGGLSWFGRLPGDIRIERETVRIYVPIVSLLVVSLVLTLFLNVLSRFF